MRSTNWILIATAFAHAVLAAPQDVGYAPLSLHRRTDSNTWKLCYDPNAMRDFKSVGCYEPFANDTSKVLRLPIGVGGDPIAIAQANVTIENCFAACKAVGSRFAALQAGAKCSCGNIVEGNPTKQKCNFVCPSDGSKPCGGQTVWSVFKDTTFEDEWDAEEAANEYENIGCYNDARGTGGVMRFSFFREDRTLTLEKCLGACAKEGFPYAGVESRRWCNCGGTMRPDAPIHPNPNACNTPCDGNGGQICGGDWAMTVYYNSDLDTGSRDCSGFPSGPRKTSKNKPKKPKSGSKKPGQEPMDEDNEEDKGDREENKPAKGGKGDRDREPMDKPNKGGKGDRESMDKPGKGGKGDRESEDDTETETRLTTITEVKTATKTVEGNKGRKKTVTSVETIVRVSTCTKRLTKPTPKAEKGNDREGKKSGPRTVTKTVTITVTEESTVTEAPNKHRGKGKKND
ncbi:hypothetical protein Dda_3954 [Drechslerella dactyloides]|uniref:WSC domain-containing protein n=1 Tax=Drechslerella dactyloides TaxID=74499 RepID=A0AAD6J168_DREDA|nr:hypothetical protein Dda_3954 [Drechslerella dactyloides]